MIKITNEIIESYNPCKHGVDKFNKLYPKYNDSLSNLLSLENVSYDDKIWLVVKVVNIKILQQWSIECAEMVVDNYNKMYPDDNRVSDCIEMTKLYLLGECSLEELESAADSVTDSVAESAARSVTRSAADYAARYVTRSAARSAARSADCAARSADCAARSAARSADCAARSADCAASSAARSAAWSAARSAANYAVRPAAKNQQDLNLSILIALLED